MPRGFAEDYVMVNERIVAFKKEFPDGSLQSEIIELKEDYVLIRGLAYRTPDDERPGIGHSSMKIPGSTPYTRGSEIENCETSAWGRALAALGFEVKRGIASKEEIDNKTDGEVEITASDAPPAERGGRTASANEVQIREVERLSKQIGLGVIGMRNFIESSLGHTLLLPDDEKVAARMLVQHLESLDRTEISALLSELNQLVDEDLPE